MDALTGPKHGPMLSRWSAILCGAVVALGVFLVVMTVWLVLVASGNSFVVCSAFGGGLILAGLAASIAASRRRPDGLYRVSREAEKQFVEEYPALAARSA